MLQNYQAGLIPIQINGIAQIQLLELLGSGAFGMVWKVKDTKTDRLYALKLIQAIKPGSIQVERVRLEAEILIDSEHIVPVLGLREWDANTFLILFEYFPARSLDRVLIETGVTPARKRHMFNQILQGVADAHRNNVIHRDLKPDNILVDHRDRVKLIDFGLSKFKGKGLTLSGDIMGTPPYMSPELLIHGARVADARVDIYALGHILYEMAVGCTFWARQGWAGHGFKEFVEFLSQVPQPQECIDLSDFHCDFYPQAGAVLARMVKTNPAERYATVEQVMQALAIDRTAEVSQPPESVRPISLLPSLPPTLPPTLPTTLPATLPTVNLKYPLLIVESGSNKNARTLVNVQPEQRLVLGRADIAGNDRTISGQHLGFTRQGDRYLVQDLNSKNGTLLNGVMLDPTAPPTPLHNGDRLKIGDVFLSFVLPSLH